MNIVFFVESYYHNAQMNGICVERVASKLASLGHNVKVFTSSKHVYDIPKYEKIDGVEVYAIKRDLDTFLRLYMKHDGKKHRILSFFHKYYAMLVHVVMSRRWPQRSFFTASRYFHLSNKKTSNEKIDAIIGTYFHIEEVLAAIKLKKKHPEATLITYTLDAMTGRESPLIFKRPELARRSIEKWEKKVYSMSDKICVMESHREHYEKGNYSSEILKKLKYVEVPLLELNDNLVTKNDNNGKDKIIVYTGCASEATGSPEFLIRLLKNITGVQLHLYGSITEEVQKSIKESGLENKKVFFHGRLEHSEIIKVQEEADYLATFGSVNACMISGKIFEYLARKKPIICTYKIDADKNIEYIRKYPNSIIIRENENNISEETEKLERFINCKDFKKIDNEFLRKTFCKSTPEAMIEEILEAKSKFNE